MRYSHQKTDLSVGFSENSTKVESNLDYHLKRIILYINVNVKFCVDKLRGGGGICTLRTLGDNPDPLLKHPHTALVYHTLSILFILFTFHFSLLALSVVEGFTYVSPVYAEHPVGTTGEYCVGEAGGERWFDASDGNHRFIPPKCSDQEDCREFTDSSDYNYTRCISRNTGTPPGSTTNFGPDPAGLVQIEAVFGRVISLFVGLAFVALAVVLVWAGIKFLTSGGEPKALEAARNAVTWALLGILFLAIAWLVLQLVAAFTGIEALKVFNIKTLCVPGIVGC